MNTILHITDEICQVHTKIKFLSLTLDTQN
jgi:hypothetical protein